MRDKKKPSHTVFHKVKFLRTSGFANGGGTGTRFHPWAMAEGETAGTCKYSLPIFAHQINV